MKFPETDKEVLKRIVAHPTFKEIQEAARLEHAERVKRFGDYPSHRPRPAVYGSYMQRAVGWVPK